MSFYILEVGQAIRLARIVTSRVSGLFVNHVSPPHPDDINSQAFFVFWKEIGHRMHIKDIPETLEDFIKLHIVSQHNAVNNHNLTSL